MLHRVHLGIRMATGQLRASLGQDRIRDPRRDFGMSW